MKAKSWVLASPVLLVVAGFLSWNALWRPAGPDPLAPLEESWAVRQKEETVRVLETQVARLVVDLENKVREVAELRRRLGEPVAEPDVGYPSDPTDQESARAQAYREVKYYKTVQTASVFEAPSNAAKPVATLPKGIMLRVVGSVDDWLEVQSIHGRPPGYVRIDDAVLVGGENSDPTGPKSEPSFRQAR